MKTDALDSIPMVARQAIEQASAATGVDFSLLVETARRESSFNPSARAPTSSATGLFQFIESTWLETVRRHGGKHGLGVYASQIEHANGRTFVSDPQVRQQILDLRYDPELSARMGAELAKDNAAALTRRLDRAPSAGEIYAAHVLGAGGAARLIAAAEEGAPSAADLFPREAAANRWLFYGRDGQERSAQALMARFDGQAGGGRSAPSTAPGLGLASVQLAAAEPVAAPTDAVSLLRGRTRLEDAAPRAIAVADFRPLDQRRAAEQASALMMVELLIDATRSKAMSMLSATDLSDSMQDSARGLAMYRRMAS